MRNLIILAMSLFSMQTFAMGYQPVQFFYAGDNYGGIQWLSVYPDRQHGLENLMVFPMQESVVDTFAKLDKSRDHSHPLSCQAKAVEFLVNGAYLLQVFDIKNCQ